MIDKRIRQGGALPCLLLFTGTAFAQQAIVDHCRKASSDADRIACLEAALLAREPAPVAEPVPSPPEPAPAAPAPKDTAAAPAVAGIGASQVAARTRTTEDERARLESATGLKVAAYETVHYQRLQVTLENGQVWLQIKGDTQNVRVDLERNQTVDILESILGGYRLRLNELGRTVRVQRIK